MPFPTEHSARLQPPSKYIRFRRGNDEFGAGIDVIWGVTEDGTVELQAIRFDADRFTPAEARAWLDEHDEHEVLEFEEATGEVENVLRLTSNLADTAHVRRENVDGVAYLVAPAVLVVEGVMNGEFVSAEEIEHLFQTWNGRPIVLDHPVDATGESVTANDPAVLASIGVGQLFNATFDDGALSAETWIGIERARSLGGDALELVRRLEKGQLVELSTAYFRDREEVMGEFNGEAYDAVARHLKPDHLAILLDDVGACSVQDGCGVPRVNEEESMETNILSEARRPAFDGTEEIPWADVDKNFEAYRDGYFEHTDAEPPDELPTDVADAPQAMRDWIAAKSLLGDPEAETFEDLLFFPVVNPDTDWLNKEAVEAVVASEADIPEAALESARSVAGELLTSEYSGEENTAKNMLRSAMRVISNALGLTENQDSLEELSRRVRIAWENRNLDDGGKFVGLSIKEVLNGNIIVETEEGLSSVPYVDESGDIQFGQPSRVEVVYQPISEEEQEVNNVDELIQRIMNDGRLNTSEEDLSNVPENLLQAIVAMLESFVKPEDQEEDVLPPEVNEPETEQPAADTSPPATEPAAETVPVTDPAVNVQLEALQAQVDALTANATADMHERKARFVNALIANSECTYSKKELEAKDVEELEKLSRWVAPTNYAGQGGGPLSVTGNNGPVVMRLAPKRQEANNG